MKSWKYNNLPVVVLDFSVEICFVKLLIPTKIKLIMSTSHILLPTFQPFAIGITHPRGHPWNGGFQIDCWHVADEPVEWTEGLHTFRKR